MIIDAMLISKIKNIIIMLLSAISSDKIDRVDHYLDDTLTEKYRDLINRNITNNVYQHFDQLNVGDVEILSNSENLLTAKVAVKFIDYKTDRQTGRIVSGNNTTRITYDVVMKFRKNNVEERMIYRCPNCGASLAVNQKSFCNYCGKPVDERYSPVVLYEINKN